MSSSEQGQVISYHTIAEWKAHKEKLKASEMLGEKSKDNEKAIVACLAKLIGFAGQTNMEACLAKLIGFAGQTNMEVYINVKKFLRGGKNLDNALVIVENIDSDNIRAK
nr:thioredoxin H-type 1 [Tanacetum cinerariifolium]